MEKASKTEQAVSLDELVTTSELLAKLSNIFPSAGSLDWELRQHRAEYLEGGALFEIGRRMMIHPPTFQRIALEIGARRVAKRAQRGGAST